MISSMATLSNALACGQMENVLLVLLMIRDHDGDYAIVIGTRLPFFTA